MGAIGIGAAALGTAGALFGSGDETTQTTRVNLARESGFNRQLRGDVSTDFGALRSLVSQQEQVLPGLEAVQQFGQALQAGGPQLEISRGREQAERLFAGERAGLQNFFQELETGSAREAAQLGRTGADPILQAKLAQQKGQAFTALQGRQTAAAGQLAQQFGQQRFQALGQRAQLAQSRLSARQGLLGLGSRLLQQERQFRLQRSGQTTRGQEDPGLVSRIGGIAGAAGSILGRGGIGGLSSGGGTTGGGP